ncbi:hypothetical protein CVT24_000812 [Panaeolus cyanescens]|uniref:Uncharacterized protein n=1 Tax=Panaeolus cyanescens TaxID=181874 RepID=A0A409YTI2_9AGAR|nr:hypothetical protein CVT24_000812 [Panaeolus cyanescens]
MEEIRRAVKEDERLENLSIEEEKALLGALSENRDVRKKGARIDNKAATLDVANTFQRIDQELTNLYERTGAPSFALVSRGHIKDSIIPSFTSSGGASEFLLETFKLRSDEVVQLFEQWACARAIKNKKAPTISTIQGECSKLIALGLGGSKQPFPLPVLIAFLARITGKNDVEMSYVNYKGDIELKLGVRLCGWPAGIPFAAPGNIKRIADVQSLKEALSSGHCTWSTMTRAEIDKVRQELHGVSKTRKRRSDADQKRGPNKKKKRTDDAQPEDGGEGSEAAATAPKKRGRPKKSQKIAAMVPPSFKSAETIENSDEEGDGEAAAIDSNQLDITTDTTAS